MKTMMTVIFVVLLAGCATIETALDVAEILLGEPAPVPVCDADSASTQFNGKACLKYDDGVYRWTPIDR